MTDNLPIPRPARPMMIQGLTTGLPERGRLKIGIKGRKVTSRAGNEFQPPQKLDHFLITTMDRGEDGNFKQDAAIHAKLGEKPTEIPVRLLYDDPTLNFPTRYACYNGKTLWCTGDGVQASRVAENGQGHQTVQCPCPRKEPGYPGKDACKMNGSLGVLIDGAGGVGGVWKFRTTSYNSIVGILSSLGFIRQITGGVLANIPLRLTVRPKQASKPDGTPVTIQVVGIEYPGDIEALQQIGHTIALERAKTHVSIENIENEARRLLLMAPADVPLPGDTTEDVLDEFYPEQVAPAAPATPRPTRESVAQAKPSMSFEIVTTDGVVLVIEDAGTARDAFVDLLMEATTKATLEALWESNTLSGQLRDSGEIALADAVQDCYTERMKALDTEARPAPAADTPPAGEAPKTPKEIVAGIEKKLEDAASVETLDLEMDAARDAMNALPPRNREYLQRFYDWRRETLETPG